MQILLVEDNQKMAANLKKLLKHELYQVDIALTGYKALELAETNRYNLIILDLALPDIDGQEVCQNLRQDENKTPILMLTARIDLESKVAGLDRGADDYLTKPFLVEEFLARVRALLRRNGQQKQNIFNIVDLEINLNTKQINKAGKKLSLSPTEFKILEFLLLSKGQVQEAAKIYEAVWGSNSDDIFFSNTLKVHIARLRKKIAVNLIKTVPGSGYLIE